MRCAGMADLRLFERPWGKILVDGLDHVLESGVLMMEFYDSAAPAI